MKRTKSILAVILALALVLVSGVVAFAAGEGSITVKNAVNGKKYSIYRIFDIASHTADKDKDGNYNGVIYKVNSDWADFFANGAKGLEFVNVGSNGIVTKTFEESQAKAFAEAASKFVTDKNLAPVVDTQTAANGKAEFNNLELGYYLVKSDLGAVCSLNTAKPHADINEKNGEPTLEKEVQENSTKDWGKTNDANIGDTVNFRITVNAIDGEPKNYVIHDKMSDSFTFKAIDSIKITRNNHDNVLTKDTDYTISTNCEGDGCTFEISFAENLIKPNDVIVVEYSATINASAVVSGTGYPNESLLEYGDNNRTEKSITRTYVWKIDVLKYTTDSENKEIGLGDAEFKLYKEVGGKKLYAEVKNNKITGWTEDVNGKDTTLVSAGDGKIEIVGLDEGTYYLEETEAPAGYNKLAAPVKVVITKEINNETNEGTATITYSYDGGAASTGTVKVLNNKGQELPSTGGIGTTIFYIVGAVLVAAAGILLITKKRMSKTAD